MSENRRTSKKGYLVVKCAFWSIVDHTETRSAKSARNCKWTTQKARNTPAHNKWQSNNNTIEMKDRSNVLKQNTRDEEEAAPRNKIKYSLAIQKNYIDTVIWPTTWKGCGESNTKNSKKGDISVQKNIEDIFVLLHKFSVYVCSLSLSPGLLPSLSLAMVSSRSLATISFLLPQLLQELLLLIVLLALLVLLFSLS